MNINEIYRILKISYSVNFSELEFESKYWELESKICEIRDLEDEGNRAILHKWIEEGLFSNGELIAYRKVINGIILNTAERKNLQRFKERAKRLAGMA